MWAWAEREEGRLPGWSWVCECMCGAALGARCPGLRGGRWELSSSCERGGWPWGLARAARARASRGDAGPLCGAQQVRARSSADQGETMGCRDVPRSEAPGEVL